jgi:hypothetical protein
MGRPYRRAEYVMEEVRFLKDQGLDRHQIATRLGMQWDSIALVFLRAQKRMMSTGDPGTGKS